MPLPSDPTFGCRYAPATAQLSTLVAPPFIPADQWQQILDEAQRRLNSPLPSGASAQHLLYPYLRYILTVDYAYKNNIIQLPVAKKPAPLPSLGKTLETAPSPPGGTTAPAPSGPPSLLPPEGQGVGGIAEVPPPAFSPTPQGTSNSGGSTMEIPKYGDVAPQQASGSGATVPDTAASNRPAAKIIQVGAPTGEKIVRFEIVRLGAQPEIPDPTPKNANEVLAESNVKMYAPQAMPDGSGFLWAAMGVYVYKLLQPYWVSDGLVGGSTPADNTSLQSNWYQNGQYAGDLA